MRLTAIYYMLDIQYLALCALLGYFIIAHPLFLHITLTVITNTAHFLDSCSLIRYLPSRIYIRRGIYYQLIQYIAFTVINPVGLLYLTGGYHFSSYQIKALGYYRYITRKPPRTEITVGYMLQLH